MKKSITKRTLEKSVTKIYCRENVIRQDRAIWCGSGQEWTRIDKINAFEENQKSPLHQKECK